MGLFDFLHKKDDVAKEMEQLKHRQQRQEEQQERDSVPDGLAGEMGLLVVEDVFSITGRGTVVTGMVSAGSFTAGDTVEITCGDERMLRATVSGLEAFRKRLNSVHQGDHVGILLAGIRRDEIGRGDVIRKL